jgi:DNA-binding response OmpR family regulator
VGGCVRKSMAIEQGGYHNFHSKGTVCLVDDEKDILSIMKKGLEQDRFIVHDFTDPRKALDHFLLNGKDYTVVIADIRMPVMNGFTFCRRIKESRPQTPVILMSAFEIGRSEFAKVMPHTTVDGFIQKPISLRELRELLNQFASSPK